MRIVITGANRGVGLALVKRLLVDDHEIIATCRLPQSADALLQLAETHDTLSVYPLDVTDADSVSLAAQQIAADYGAIDALLNNAGVLHREPSLDSVDIETMRHVLNVNSVGPLIVLQQFHPLLKAGSNPRVINTSSQLGSVEKAITGWGTYSYNASKAALNVVARMVAAEFPWLISIALHPGWVQTDMGGPSAAITPQASAEGIATVLTALTIDDTGKFFTWDGRAHVW